MVKHAPLVQVAPEALAQPERPEEQVHMPSARELQQRSDPQPCLHLMNHSLHTCNAWGRLELLKAEKAQP